MKWLKFLMASSASLFLFSSSLMAISPKNDPVEKKIDKLISRMTLEEKIGQMNQISSFVQ